MPSHPKAAAHAVPEPSSSSIPDMLGDWVRQGTEGFIATQKILLDLAAQQNALALMIVRERLSMFSLKPSKAAIHLIGRGTHNLFEAQRALLDLVARQNMIVSEGLKPGYTGTPVEGLAQVLHRGLENFIECQKRFLEIFEEQSDGAIKDFGQGNSFDTGRLTESAREGMRTFLNSQKKFIDIVEEELVEAKTAPRKKTEAEKLDLLEVVKQSVDSFVKVQEQLLDIASDQVDADVQFASDVVKPAEHRKHTTAFPEVVKKSVDSFVAAQKALVELASKPRKAAHADGLQSEAVGAKA